MMKRFFIKLLFRLVGDAGFAHEFELKIALAIEGYSVKNILATIANQQFITSLSLSDNSS